MSRINLYNITRLSLWMRKWISSQINRQHYYDGSLWGCVDTNFSRNYFLFTALAFYSIFYFDYYIYLCAMHSGLLSTLTKSIGNSIFTSKREYLCTLLFVDSIRQEKHFRYLAFVVIHNSFVCTFCERTLTHTHMVNMKGKTIVKWQLETSFD